MEPLSKPHAFRLEGSPPTAPVPPPALEAAEQAVPSSNNVHGSISDSNSWAGRVLLLMGGRFGVNFWKGAEFVDVEDGVADDINMTGDGTGR